MPLFQQAAKCVTGRRYSTRYWVPELLLVAVLGDLTCLGWVDDSVCRYCVVADPAATPDSLDCRMAAIVAPATRPPARPNIIPPVIIPLSVLLMPPSPYRGLLLVAHEHIRDEITVALTTLKRSFDFIWERFYGSSHQAVGVNRVECYSGETAASNGDLLMISVPVKQGCLATFSIQPDSNLRRLLSSF